MKIKSAAFLLLFYACTKDSGLLDHGGNYPREVGAILSTKCAISGCHNAVSKDASAGLSLTNWEAMFQGSRGGAAVIPYRPDYSTLCFYTNSFSELGPTLTPKMPIGLNPLSKEEYLLLKNWIAQGAPDINGNIKFQSSLNKLYVTNQLCDLVMVLDGESKLLMRAVDVGVLPKQEFPVCIKISPDKRNWYVSFLASRFLQKFDATNDVFIGSIDLGEGVWSSFEISADSKHAWCVDNGIPGKIAYVDLEAVKVLKYYVDPNFVYPRSVVLHAKTKKLYVGAENGNYISVIDTDKPNAPVVKQLVLDGSTTINPFSLLDPTILCISEELNLCFVGCQHSNEIKVLDVIKDSVIKTIFLNAAPTTIDYSLEKKALFISCMNDSLSFPGNLGSVKVISLESYQIMKVIHSGFQPNGISVNQRYGYVAVVNSNISPKGPKPHHTSGCTGRNGNIAFIDLNTLELIPNKKSELAVYPSAIAIKE